MTDERDSQDPAQPAGLYHERQRLQLCLLHALNNLFQGHRAFSKPELDRIADDLVPLDTTTTPSWLRTPWSLVHKPHRTAVTGNYDANVLMAALKTRGADAQWYDCRKGGAGLDLDDDGGVVGVMLNVKQTKVAGLWRTRHWLALRSVGGWWYNLDSDLPAPVPLGPGSSEEVQGFLRRALDRGAEIFVVRRDDAGAAAAAAAADDGAPPVAEGRL